MATCGGQPTPLAINKMKKYQIILMVILFIGVTAIFYFILRALGTNNLIFSTISVTTSFLAVYMTFLRSPYYAIGYALNDIVLIVLWVLASIHEIRYISVVVCFVAFFVNDIYGYISWKKMKIRQNKN